MFQVTNSETEKQKQKKAKGANRKQKKNTKADFAPNIQIIPLKLISLCFCLKMANRVWLNFCNKEKIG